MESTQEEIVPIRKKKPMKMMDAVLYALLFVFAWATFNQYRAFGSEIAIHAVLKLIVACLTGWLTHVVFYVLVDHFEKKEFSSLWERLTANHKKITRNVPFITAMILSIRFRSNTPLPLIILAVILAELVGKLMWGGFGKNMVNPVAVGFLLTDLLFEQYNRMPILVDGVTSATPLDGIATHGWYFGADHAASFRESFGSLWAFLIGQPTVAAPSAEMARLAVLIAFAFMVYQKALDWIVPVLYVGTVFVISAVVGLYHGFDMAYPF